ncbi:accessory Sec system S-layer assembly protein [Desertibacillus haloalkaliphilus]|uniref:accessory Sec system S-layer assembly protein n=1 Tax=Desertibacillus haloalkaliphilus TaxID=1328930 RepID=UPI001C26AE24|nr:accessory Sec system S-layer assembly protein [Desertibacillus haloalkaliphilus]MBU8905968.1 accessory Sec system S-layer assembly protein [Desertibacillus haloalkaliphilus]
MLPFFKKKNGESPKMEGSESTVSSEELLDETSTDSSDDEIYTELSIHPEWNIPKEDRYAFQFLNQELPPLKPNQLSLSGINIMQSDDGSYRIAAFVRNSLDKAIKLEDATLVLLDDNDEVLGRKAFNLADVGEIPAKSARPWNFKFTSKDLFTTELPAEGWKLAFQLKPTSRKHSLELAESWEKSLAEESKQQLEEMVNKLTPPKAGEVNFMGLKANQAENGDLHVTLLIRNGSEKNVNLEQLPLQVEDASGEVIAKGGFKLEKLQVKANTSKPWTFIFPKSLITKESIDLSKWKAYPPEQKK